MIYVDDKCDRAVIIESFSHFVSKNKPHKRKNRHSKSRDDRTQSRLLFVNIRITENVTDYLYFMGLST